MARLTASALGLAALSLGPVACDDPGEATIPDGLSVYLWVSASADTHALCLYPQGCPEGSQAGQGELRVSNWPDNEMAIAYVDFPRVALPAGWEIEEAYLELFNGGTMADGTSDDRCLGVGVLTTAWDPSAIRWDAQPWTSGLSANHAGIRLRSADWSASGNIAAIVAEVMTNPESRTGFAITPQANVANQPLKKAFYSSNDPQRTADSLGRAPRVLIRLTPPAGAKLEDLDMGQVPHNQHHELGRFGSGDVAIAQAAVGDEWPSEWEVFGPTNSQPCP